MKPDLTRRRLLSAGLSVASILALPLRAEVLSTGTDSEGMLLGAWSVGEASYAGVWDKRFGTRGVLLPKRAHDVIPVPGTPSQAIAVARRPGTFLHRFDFHSATSLLHKEVEVMRYFSGHAAFSNDERTLFTSEHDLISGNGLLGVRAADTMEKLTEIPTYGVGPHEILVEPDGNLLIANGGVLTIPGAYAANQISEPISPSLVRVDPKNGKLLGQWHLPDSWLSIRHLALGRNGNVGIALQSAHPVVDARLAAPVFALLDNNRLRLVKAADGVNLQGYAGDIACVHRSEQDLFVLGCSHAEALAIWSTDGIWIGSVPLTSACAVAANGKILTAVTDKGEMVSLSESGAITRHPNLGVEWDNHAVSI